MQSGWQKAKLGAGSKSSDSHSRSFAMVAFIALSLPLAFVPSAMQSPAVSWNETAAAEAAIDSKLLDAGLKTCSTLAKPVSPQAAKPCSSLDSSLKPRTEASVRRIVVSIPHRKLAVLEHGKVKKVYPVAVGAKWSPSPAGRFRIRHKAIGPVYSHDGKVVAAGKNNPLGSRWMGLDKDHYGIHGTNQPKSIGHAASHGCIRMGKRDVEELFEIAQVGDVVEIRSERTPEIAAIFGEFVPEHGVTVASAETATREGAGE